MQSPFSPATCTSVVCSAKIFCLSHFMLHPPLINPRPTTEKVCIQTLKSESVTFVPLHTLRKVILGIMQPALSLGLSQFGTLSAA